MGQPQKENKLLYNDLGERINPFCEVIFIYDKIIYVMYMAVL